MPRIKTPTQWITMGFNANLKLAWDNTKAQTISFLSEQRKLLAL